MYTYTYIYINIYIYKTSHHFKYLGVVLDQYIYQYIYVNIRPQDTPLSYRYLYNIQYTSSKGGGQQVCVCV